MMHFPTTTAKADKIRILSKKMLCEVRVGKRWVKRSKLRSFCGVAVSMMPTIAVARF